MRWPSPSMPKMRCWMKSSLSFFPKIIFKRGRPCIPRYCFSCMERETPCARGRGQGALRPAGHEGPVGQARAGDLDALLPYSGIADRFLLPTQNRPRGRSFRAATAVSFDWRIPEGSWMAAVDYMLSGGLDAGNVACRTFDLLSPKGIDPPPSFRGGGVGKGPRPASRDPRSDHAGFFRRDQRGPARATSPRLTVFTWRG